MCYLSVKKCVINTCTNSISEAVSCRQQSTRSCPVYNKRRDQWPELDSGTSTSRCISCQAPLTSEELRRARV